METLVLIGFGMFAAYAVASVIGVVVLDRKFRRYLRLNHPEQWGKIYQDQLTKKALLWPVMRGTPVDFLWKSQEDFGDPAVRDLRRRLRRSFIGTASALVALFVWAALGAIILEYVRNQ